MLTWAEQWVPAGIASLIVIATPFWMVFFARLSGEAVRPRALSGLLLGFAGLVVLLWPDLSIKEGGAGFIAGSVGLCFGSCAWAYGSVYSKRHPSKGDPLMQIALQMILAALYLGIFGLLRGEAHVWAPGTASIGSILYLALFGSLIGYSAYIYALSHLPTDQVSVYAYVNTLVAVGLGVLFLGERLDIYILLGMPLVLWGIYQVNTARMPLLKGKASA